MNARESPRSLHSRSQLLFMSTGMKSWLETVEDVTTTPPARLPAVSGTLSIPCDLEQNALRLLTDMALHTWKEAG